MTAGFLAIGNSRTGDITISAAATNGAFRDGIYLGIRAAKQGQQRLSVRLGCPAAVDDGHVQI